MSTQQQQWLRRLSLIVSKNANGLDLSQLRVRFKVTAMDAETPNAANIRVYNVKRETAKLIQAEFTDVTLQAGYENGAFGIIFQGSINQFRTGREANIDSYLDILASDRDVPYNFGTVNATLAAGATQRDVLTKIGDQVGLGTAYLPPDLTGSNPKALARGKVLWGMARTYYRTAARTADATWSIQNGKVQVIPLTGYLPNEVVELSSLTGMVGVPEQTAGGIHVRCLINPKLAVGGLVRINNRDINRLIEASSSIYGVPYNQWAGIQYASSLSNDGLYRIYVIEYEGDSRGTPWYADLTCLAVDSSTGTVKAYG